MASTVSSKGSEWQPGHAPRLSYRNPAPVLETPPHSHIASSPLHTKKVISPGLSIREIRQALPQEYPPVADRAALSQSALQAQKGKRSFLSGLLVKEPSMAALDQVTQQMLSQNGSSSPKSLPYVTSQKMPHHVPKVNSKWDGVPEYVKTREKEEKDKTKAGKRNSFLLGISRSQNTYAEEQKTRPRRSSNSGSNADSWDSRSTASRPVFQDDVSVRPGSLYSVSSGESSQPVQSLTSGKTYSSFTTPSTRSPETTSFATNDSVPSLRGMPRLKSSQSSSTQATMSSDRSPRMNVPPADAIPEYTSSAVTTPIEHSPRTPALHMDDDNSLDAQLMKDSLLISSGPKILPVPSTAKRNSISRTQAVPWETQKLPVGTSTGVRYSRDVMPVDSSQKSRANGRTKR